MNRIDESSKWLIARVFADVPELSGEANAHLIAAAPELLEALKAILRIIDPNGRLENCEQARVAIARAEKEQAR